LYFKLKKGKKKNYAVNKKLCTKGLLSFFNFFYF